jgi:ASC-1-like (ASCH) protein
MKTTHHLKCWPSYFEAVMMGDKTFEIRKNDRDFKVGDTIILHHHDPGGDVSEPMPTPSFRIRYILAGHEGLQPGFVILQLERLHV